MFDAKFGVNNRSKCGNYKFTDGELTSPRIFQSASYPFPELTSPQHDWLRDGLSALSGYIFLSALRGRWNRETWQPGTMSPSLISPSQCVTPWCRWKRLNCTWKCPNKYNSWCRNSHRRVRWRTLRKRQWRDIFFLDNRLSQITVQTFSIIIATFPSANTYLCCWRCLLVNNIWLCDCALTGALSCFIERRRTVNCIQDDAMMTTKT